jgi:hypothetical protein
MFFTHLGRVVAILALVFGILEIVVGVMSETGMMVLLHFPDTSAPGSGVPYSSSQSGQVIEWGIYTVLLAIALGILTEISRSVRALSKTPV